MQGVLMAFMSLVIAVQGITLWAVAKRLQMHVGKRHHDGRN